MLDAGGVGRNISSVLFLAWREGEVAALVNILRACIRFSNASFTVLGRQGALMARRSCRLAAVASSMMMAKGLLFASSQLVEDAELVRVIHEAPEKTFTPADSSPIRQNRF